MALVKAKVSSVVSRQVPEFIREDNTQFIAFLEAYYEFLEQTEKRNLESTRDIDDTVDSFIQYFRNEVLLHIPTSVISDKRYLAKQIHEVYRSKGTIKSYEFLFRVLFNETPELYFPKVDMLRLSDGKWNQSTTIRCTETSGNSFNLIGQTVTQDSNRATVESVIKFQIGTSTVAELTLNEQSIVGTFDSSLPLTGYDNVTGSLITLDILSVITGFDILNTGAYYSVGSPVDLISGTGQDAQVEVTNIGYGSVTELVIDTPGSGYSVGTELLFDNTNAGDINDSLVSARAIITDIDIDSILMEDDSVLLKEDRGQFDIENATTGGIKAVQLITGGFYYKKLPIVNTTGGTGAKVLAVGNGIGRVVNVGITNPGFNYDSIPIAVFPVNIVVKDIVDTFSVGDQISIETQTMSLETNADSEFLLESGDKIVLESQQSPIGTIYSIDVDRNLITLYPTSDRIVTTLESGNGNLLSEEGLTFVNEISGQFETNQTIINTTGASAKIISGSGNHAEARGIIGPIGRTLGKFVNADGKISESSKKIQDSFFYQEYSYVVKVGQSIDKYRDAVKKLLHPIGLALFGEVTVQSTVNASTNVTAAFSQVLHTIRSFLDLKMKAVGNYRTAYESDSSRSKEQITLELGVFLASVLRFNIQESEFLPVLHLPELTPDEVYLLDTRADLIQNVTTLLLPTVQVNGEILNPETYIGLLLTSQKDTVARGIGPNLGWLEKWKFTIPPYAAGSKNSIGVYTDAWDQPYTGSVNAGYWGTYASTQIKDFANVIIGDVINNANRRTNYANEAYIDIINPNDGFYTFDGNESMDNNFITMDELDARFDSTNNSITTDSASIRFDLL